MEKLIYMLVVVSIIASCKKKENENAHTTGEPTTYASYLPLKAGNYWIYENVNLDTNGNYTSLGVIDSDYIAGDTVVNGNTYFIWHRNNLVLGEVNYLVKDSLHYLVDNTGAKLFSSENFTDTLSFAFYVEPPGDTINSSFCKMTERNVNINVPAGIFTTNNSKTTIYIYPPFANDYINPKILNHRYAENTGLIYETLIPFTSEPGYKVRRLLRYHLN